MDKENTNRFPTLIGEITVIAIISAVVVGVGVGGAFLITGKIGNPVETYWIVFTLTLIFTGIKRFIGSHNTPTTKSGE
jgi:hypothetical protein